MIELSEFFSGKALEKARARQSAGEPTAYIIGRAWFYREEYEITRGVLIPRPDTERVVEKLVDILPKGGHFTDLCCGSGCIGISALCERADARAFACDISEQAVALSLRNAKKNGVADRYQAVCADLHTLQIPPTDLVVANPPYIPHAVIAALDRSVRDYEPTLALDGGDDGLDFYRVILDRFQAREGFLFEIGYDQGQAIRALCDERSMSCEITKDYGGNDRVAVIRKR